MAAKPTLSNAEWATDATFSSGPDSGQNTKVSASAGVKAQGWRPGDALGYVGAWFNYWMNQIYAWMAYLSDGDLTGNHSITGNLTMPAGSIDVQTGYVQAEEFRIDHASQELIYLTPRARLIPLALCITDANPAAFAYRSSSAGAGSVSAGPAAEVGVQQLKLPYGAVLTDVFAVHQNFGAITGTGAKLEVFWTAVDYNPSGGHAAPSASLLGSYTFNTTTTAELGSITGLLQAQDDTGFFTLVFTTANNAGPGTTDNYFGVRLGVIDPGPRNY